MEEDRKTSLIDVSHITTVVQVRKSDPKAIRIWKTSLLYTLKISSPSFLTPDLTWYLKAPGDISTANQLNYNNSKVKEKMACKLSGSLLNEKILVCVWRSYKSVSRAYTFISVNILTFLIISKALFELCLNALLSTVEQKLIVILTQGKSNMN